MHRSLRGRYVLALSLGITLACVMAPGAYKAASPRFTSTGIVRVAPVVPKVLYSSDQNQLLPMFDSYVAAQVVLAGSRPVLERAIGRPEMREIAWPEGPQGVAQLQGSLKVERSNRSELFQVSVASQKPVMAKVAVNAVLDAYAELFSEQNEMTASVQERTLESREAQLQEQLRQIQDEMLASTDEYGPANIAKVHAARVESLENLDKKIAELTSTIAEQEARADGATPTVSDAEVTRLTVMDNALSDLVVRRAERQARHNVASMRHGPKHPEVLKAELELQAINKEIEHRTQQLSVLGSTGVLTQAGGGAQQKDSLEQLKTLRNNLQQARQKTMEESTRLSQKSALLASLDMRMEETKRLLNETRSRLEQIRVERSATFPGRVSVAVRGTMPVAPASDKRKPAAAAGGAAGLMTGVGGVMLYGMLRRRYRYSDELDRLVDRAQVLGVVPEVSPRSATAGAVAAQAVHHLRNLLQIRFGRQCGTRVILVTGSEEGEGKTSLALALASSFAEAKLRTVVIDAHLAGRGLTRQLGLEGTSGLREIVLSGRVNGELTPVNGSGLLALGAGQPAESDGQLSHGALGSVLLQLRDRADVIILDGGSACGDLDATLAAALSDEVILVVRRGQNAASVDAALASIRKVHPSPVGLVMNRASEADAILGFARRSGAAACAIRSARVGSSPRNALLRALEEPRAQKERVS